MKHILKTEGLRGLTRGIEPSIGREVFYSTIRIGGYEPVRNLVGGGKDTSPIVKYSSALITGGIGAAVANPFDLVKTRFQAAVVKKGESGTGYPYGNTLAAFRHIIKHEGGAKALYKGSSPTIIRASLVTSSQLGTYDSVKNNVLKKMFGFQEGYPLHLLSAFAAGIVITLVSNPADVIKSRYMADASKGNAKKYANVLDCVKEVYRERAFYRGATAAYTRFAPHSFISLVGIEKVRQLFGLSGL